MLNQLVASHFVPIFWGQNKKKQFIWPFSRPTLTPFKLGLPIHLTMGDMNCDWSMRRQFTLGANVDREGDLTDTGGWKGAPPENYPPEV